VSDVNSTLPDDDALKAFANSALGRGSRRRRGQGASGTEAPAETQATTPAADDAPPVDEPPATADAAPAAEEAAPARAAAPEPAPAQEPAPTVAEPVGEETATVPAPAPTPAPETAPAPAPAPAVESPAAPAPAAEVAVRAVAVPHVRTSPLPAGLQDGAVIEVRVPQLGPAGTRGVQCTVMIRQEVRDRFARYQLEKKLQGEDEPSNSMVVRRAFLHAQRNDLFGEILRDVYHAANALGEEDYDEGGLLGDVVGRRTTRGRTRHTTQQSFRPSEQELAAYDAFQTAYGFPDRSAFIDGLLDRFLPPLPPPGRRR